ncbi:arsenate reductase (glutaredoxin) [Bradyrhizobium sp. LA7.1]|uniref:arsenate reductase (glutaredoxin) n=1 Tax=Bradyrhizobium sp. LA7.1 TaxID=3156324 RepID=UPI00339515CC
MDVIIYHNPDCGTPRSALATIRSAGIEPHVVEYLRTPPSRAPLQQSIARMGISVHEAVREKAAPDTEPGLDNPAQTDDQLLEAMMVHPILSNRPIVVTPNDVRLCRPSGLVLDLLPAQQRPAG